MLVNQGFLERQGQKRGARYRLAKAQDVNEGNSSHNADISLHSADDSLHKAEDSLHNEADVLYLSIGDPKPAIGVDIGDRVVVRYDPENEQVVGITVIGLQTRLKAELES